MCGGKPASYPVSSRIPVFEGAKKMIFAFPRCIDARQVESAYLAFILDI
jgi:hypothetical protein